ncbi:MAG: nucleotidyl transferase AbiEii/AbiGii toxin family protein [Lentimicrobium sp.]|nr:nucleotidyl transferase AbiEii/AbiGii toxin family protein [Lentimicrobium sp.]
MGSKLHYNTTTHLQLSILKKLMGSTEFNAFRLVGGTGLSLHRGHRLSVDIDLFSDASYGSIDFDTLNIYLRNNWPYIDTNDIIPVGMGKSFFVGFGKHDCIKLDLYYTDDFIDDFQVIDGIRLASVDEILAMKVDVIDRGGRKKDFWDIHELKDDYALAEMLELHNKRYPYSHNSQHLINKFTDFNQADYEFDPICLRKKHWEIIKLELIQYVNSAKG